MHHRPSPIRTSSTTRASPLLPSNTVGYHSPTGSPNIPSDKLHGGPKLGMSSSSGPSTPRLDTQVEPSVCGMPLKYVSLVTLAVQNAALSIVMHYSRISTPPHLSYSPASAVLLNELLKGSISFLVAVASSPLLQDASPIAFPSISPRGVPPSVRNWTDPAYWKLCTQALRATCTAIFSPDCWKLSIPAVLYVVQNSLQFVAIGNLPVATFQVTYQMKILTTALFSVLMLKKRLSTRKWLALVALALGVGIVQIQTSSPPPSHQHQHQHHMNPLTGFGAVTFACFTSGLAGVYFEMVLKGSKTDLWVRNVQLSLFSLVPALLPVLMAWPSAGAGLGFWAYLTKNFTPWAWATVFTQVLGGLITAVVIKYSDNIMKGFATSLSIVLSFLASVILFNFQVGPGFVIGAGVVLGATWVYNQPEHPGPGGGASSSTGRGGNYELVKGSPIIAESAMKKGALFNGMMSPSPSGTPANFNNVEGYFGRGPYSPTNNATSRGPGSPGMRRTSFSSGRGA